MPSRGKRYRVKVGPVFYTVEEANMAGTEMAGETEQSKSLIRIHSEQQPDQKVSTAYHELTHAVIIEYGIHQAMGWDHDTHERFVGMFAPAMLTTLQQNPELRKVLFKK